MADLYHFAMMRLREGSIIEPGNWGRLLKRYEHKEPTPLFGSPWVLCRELIFEMVRVESFPEKPSRLSAAFAVEGRDDANTYRASNDRNFQQALHQVEIVDVLAASHRGSLSMTRWPEARHFLDPTRELALQYWRGEGDGPFEIVTASSLRVLACID